MPVKENKSNREQASDLMSEKAINEFHGMVVYLAREHASDLFRDLKNVSNLSAIDTPEKFRSLIVGKGLGRALLNNILYVIYLKAKSGVIDVEELNGSELGGLFRMLLLPETANPDYKKLLKNYKEYPDWAYIVSDERKLAKLKQDVFDGASEELLDFLIVLTKNRRVDVFYDVGFINAIQSHIQAGGELRKKALQLMLSLVEHVTPLFYDPFQSADQRQNSMVPSFLRQAANRLGLGDEVVRLRELVDAYPIFMDKLSDLSASEPGSIDDRYYKTQLYAFIIKHANHSGLRSQCYLGIMFSSFWVHMPAGVVPPIQLLASSEDTEYFKLIKRCLMGSESMVAEYRGLAQSADADVARYATQLNGHMEPYLGVLLNRSRDPWPSFTDNLGIDRKGGHALGVIQRLVEMGLVHVDDLSELWLFRKGSASVQGKFSLCPLALSLLVSLSQQAENRLKVISKFTAGYLFGWMGRSLKLLKPTESDETSEANDVHEGVLSQGLGLISYLLKQPGNAVVMSSQLVKLSTRFFRKCVSESGGCHYNTSPLDGLLDEYLELLVSAQTVADLGRFISIKSVQPLLLMMSQIGIEMESHFDFGGRRLKRFSQLMRVISHAFRVSCEEPGASKFIDEVRAFFQGFSDEDMSRLNALLDRLGKRDSELKVIGQEILGCLVRRLPKIHTVPDFVLMKESAHGKMPGTSFCSAWCVNSEDKSRWFVKAGALNSAERAKVEAVLENISGRVYQFLGAQTPETQMSVLNIHRHFRYPHADWFMSCDSQRITNTHIHFTLSKAVPKALSLSALPKFEGQPVLTITGEKGEVRVVSGLGHILAVADFLGDVDVLGGLGNNVLYQALPGKAKCWKIDHGYALTFRHNPIPKRYIRVAALGPDVAFESLPGNVKREYLETLAKIKVLPDDQIAEFFNTPGSRILHGHELPDCLIPSEMIKELILRRDLLSVVYQKDLVEQAPLTCGCSIWSHAVNDTQKNTMFAIKHTV